MISEKIISFLAKVPEKASEHASGISLNILFIVIIIFALWGIGEIISNSNCRYYSSISKIKERTEFQ